MIIVSLAIGILATFRILVFQHEFPNPEGAQAEVLARKQGFWSALSSEFENFQKTKSLWATMFLLIFGFLQYFGDSPEWWAYITKRYLDAWNDEDRFVPPKSVVHEFDYLHEVSSQCFGKPPQIITMLENFIGQAEFDDRISRFLKNHQYGTFNLTDAAQEFDGFRMGRYDMSKFLLGWFLKPGYPTVVVERRPGEFGRIRLRQTHIYAKAEVSVSSEEVWPIKVDIKTAKSRTLPIVLLDETPAEVASINFDQSQWLLANVNVTSFIRVNYDGSNWVKLAESLLNSPAAFSPITQAQIVNDFCFFYKLNLIDATNGKQALASVQKFLSQLPKSENPLRMVVEKLKC